MNLSYVHGVGTTPLIADTIGGALNGAAERWGDRDALVACHQQLRYEADRAARGLISLGVQRGDRVGIWSGNRAEWMITQYAAAKVGAVLVNINPAYRLRELEYALTRWLGRRHQHRLLCRAVAPRLRRSRHRQWP